MNDRRRDSGSDSGNGSRNRSGNRSGGPRNCVVNRAALVGAVAAAALAGLVATAVSAYAADAKGGGDTNETAWGKFMHTLGLSRPVDQRDDDIQYVDRSPLVVPQTRDLPPPETEAAPGANWPKDAGRQKRDKSKDALVTPTQPYVQLVPNPPVEPKVWYKPNTWFSKEEYGTFTAEPARGVLTDPPSGYRTPSPYQPYGIGPDPKDRPKTKTARDGTPVPGATAAPAGATAQGATAQGTQGGAAPGNAGSGDAAAAPQAPAGK